MGAMSRFQIRAAVVQSDGSLHAFVVTGQIARTLKMLVHAGPAGVTSLDIAETWALRTSHYIFVLRRDHGLVIETVRESHKGPAGEGWHARYRLITPVRILDGSEAEAA
jgi:hypothetical protein